MAIEVDKDTGTSEKQEVYRHRVIKKKIMPLVVRGAKTEEILKIVEDLEDSDRKIVEGIVEDAKEKALNSVDFINIVDIIGGKKRSNAKFPIEDQQEKVEFARMLFRKKAVPLKNESTSDFMELIKENGINVDNFYDGLRLEIYFMAVTLAYLGDRERFDLYSAMGNQLDSIWFKQSLAKEENTIRKKLGEKWSKISRWKESMAVRDGEVIYETYDSRRARLEARWGITGTSLTSGGRRRGRKSHNL